jgi:hypothetical protein
MGKVFQWPKKKRDIKLFIENAKSDWAKHHNELPRDAIVLLGSFDIDHKIGKVEGSSVIAVHTTPVGAAAMIDQLFREQPDIEKAFQALQFLGKSRGGR